MMLHWFPAGQTCYCVTGGDVFLTCSWGCCWLVEALGAELACRGGTYFSCSAAPWPFFCSFIPCSRCRELYPTCNRLQRGRESIVLCHINRWYTLLTAERSPAWYCYTAFMLFAWDLPGLLLVSLTLSNKTLKFESNWGKCETFRTF